MTLSDIEKALTQSFEDYQLSKGERVALKQVFSEFADSPDKLSFARNKSFDLVRAQVTQSRQYHTEALKWLEGVVKTIDSVRNDDGKSEVSVYFSPGNVCVNRIVALIKNAKRCIDVCVFTISDDRISDALLAAHESGTVLRVVTDDDKSLDRGSDIERLAQKGIPVKMDNSPSHMHHKFAIFDDTILLNGSFNWTRSASTNNHENIVVIDDHRCVTPFKETFEKLWQSCIQIRH